MAGYDSIWMIREGSCEEVTFLLRPEYQGVSHARIWEQSILCKGSCKYKGTEVGRDLIRSGVGVCHKYGGQSCVGQGLS